MTSSLKLISFSVLPRQIRTKKNERDRKPVIPKIPSGELSSELLLYGNVTRNRVWVKVN